MSVWGKEVSARKLEGSQNHMMVSNGYFGTVICIAAKITLKADH
jgi:hypothetical protein